MASLKLKDLLDAVHGAGRTVADVAPLMKAIEIIAQAGVKEHFTNQASPEGKPWAALKHTRVDSGGRDHILRDKGLLMNSVRARVIGHELTLTASHPAANLHQFGGTIYPKTAKMLALPLTKEAKRVGSPRQNHFPRPLFVLVSKANKAFLAENTDGRITLQYLLKRSVTVPARPFLGFSDRTLNKIEKIVADRLADIIEGVFAGRVVGLRIVL